MIFNSGAFFRGNEDVIHIDDNFHAFEAKFVLHMDHDHIHEGLEGSWGVALAEGHDFRLKKAKACFECCLPLVPFSDVYVVVSPPDIKLCVDPCASDLCD